MSDENTKFLSDLADLFKAMNANPDHAEAMHAALKKRPATFKRVLRLRYVCPNKKRCPLLDVFECSIHPDETLFYRWPYKHSVPRNLERSNEAGRQANTRDGKNHWNAQASNVDALAPLANGKGSLGMLCDHLDSQIDGQRLFNDLTAARDTPKTIVFTPA